MPDHLLYILATIGAIVVVLALLVFVHWLHDKGI